MTSYLLHIFTVILLSILKIVCLLIAIAYFTLAERKIMAAVQRRVGPNVVGPFGLLQPLADGLKLAGKELAIPAQASSRIFLTVAVTVLLFALSGWSAIPFGMFDHSEHMSSSTVAKVLVLTEPQLLEQKICYSCRVDVDEVPDASQGAPGDGNDENSDDEAASNDWVRIIEAMNTNQGVFGGGDDDNGVGCDADPEAPEDDDVYGGELSQEEQDWINRETMRFINDTYRENMTPEEIAEWALHVLNVHRAMVDYILSRH